MVVGFMLSVAAVIVATVADRSFRTAEDVEQLLGMPMVTVVPEVKHHQSLEYIESWRKDPFEVSTD